MATSMLIGVLLSVAVGALGDVPASFHGRTGAENAFTFIHVHNLSEVLDWPYVGVDGAIPKPPRPGRPEETPTPAQTTEVPVVLSTSTGNPPATPTPNDPEHLTPDHEENNRRHPQKHHDRPQPQPQQQPQHHPDKKKPAAQHNYTRQEDSLIGYEYQCGIRGGRHEEEENRIVGGSDATPGEFPWQVSLQLQRLWSSKHVCGGAVVAPYWVVTAGHCVHQLHADQLSVVAGEHNLYKVEGHEQRRRVVRIVGRGYNKNNFANDIALLQLDKPLHFGKHVSPICVPQPTKHYGHGSAIVTGWGKLSERGGLPNILQHVTVPLMAFSKCSQLYKDAGFYSFLHQCQICSGRDSGGVDSCQGDSGGPLACRHREDGRYYLCGVVSWGVGCARPNYPGVYTETSCYSRWLKKVLYNEDLVLTTHPKDLVILNDGPPKEE